MLKPKMVIKMEIQQGTIHVEKNAIDFAPIQQSPDLLFSIAKNCYYNHFTRTYQAPFVLKKAMLNKVASKRISKEPLITDCKVVAQSRLFRIEQLDITFANGQQVEYERLKGSTRGGVLVVALQDDNRVLMVREYSAGVERYELMFPKGRIESDEPVEEAANRELQEEVGFAARKLTLVKAMTLAPGYMGHLTYVVLAEELYPATLKGDEPEPLEVVSWELDKIDELAVQEDVTEARTIAAAYIVKALLDQRQ